MREFWSSAGLHLVERRADGWLVPTPDLIRGYLVRSELRPIETSCASEAALHQALMADPDLPVADDRLAMLADRDAAENYAALLAFRELLSAEGTLEAAYLRIARAKRVSLPPLFIDHLVHLILRNALADTRNALALRAAELFFREQTVSVENGQLMLADAETVSMRAAEGKESGLARMLSETGIPMRQVTLDVLGDDNADIYWERSDQFDTVIDFRFGQPAPDAFSRVVEAFLGHLLRLEVNVEPRPEITDTDWRWHIGLDAEANRILNALYAGETLENEELQRIVCLFRMRIRDVDRVLDRVRGHPVYLALAMTGEQRLRMKPQNLIANLPLRGLS